jgi:xanthine dehydrogenase YagS FAD-binding subunit
VALLLYDAEVEVAPGGRRTVAALYGDGTDARDHRLEPGELLTSVLLPPPTAGERGGYTRAIARARAEWPLIEACARLVIEDGRVLLARVAVGAMAPIPLRLPALEAALTGGPATLEAFEAACAGALDPFRGHPGLPGTRYKAAMVGPTLLDALADALGSGR